MHLYLVNANVWFWHLFDLFPEQERLKFRLPPGIEPRQRVQEVRKFLYRVPQAKIYTTDFTIHAVGIKLARYHRLNEFVEFVEFWGRNLVRLDREDFGRLRDVAQAFGLDFDDAYQVAAAEKLAAQTGCSVVIVSYDEDFDRTRCQRATPEAALKLELEQRR